jgi:hypothetical protein
LLTGLEKTKGLRVPTIPKQKENFLEEKKMGGAQILPKTYKE